MSAVMPAMVLANVIMLGICVRYSHFWKIILEFNKDPKFAPSIGCIAVLFLFFILLLVFEVM